MLKLVIWPEDVLETKTEELSDFSDVKGIADEMFEVMRKHNGVGLAAPQVGLSKRIFVMEIDNKRYVVVNPKIKSTLGKHSIHEGCLSFPNITVSVDRAATLDVEYQNEVGGVVCEKLNGITAICFQHELDHLDGKVFIEYLPKDTRTFIKGRLEREKKNGSLGA